MTYQGPEFEEAPAGRSRWVRRPVVVVVGALAAGGLLGWGAYAATGNGGGAGTAASAPGASSAPSAHGASARPTADGKAAGGKAGGPLAGKVIVIDPGHNPGNYRHTAEINRTVDIGTHRKECDTTGTATNAGYSEARYTLDVAHRLRTLLQAQGATVKLTHDGDKPAWGPCVDQRARIGNTAHADAAISLHADGAPAGDRGFHVIMPGSVHAGIADTRRIVAPSHDLGVRLAGAYRRVTGEPVSNYLGHGTGLVTRTDLGGLNLSTVPKVFIECGNMRDKKDAALLTSGAWRQKAAQGMSEGIADFLRGS
ncbi:N-acetylmuramoyl-L-alanine amidase [Streptomyces sp. J2-1]|uniref:N-acetylmuramoyl-L-alanine amidase n=1 Tax=Streptomyces corallincola TaxID=2851888 RepID=UPI001C38FEB3|nr:N-acetylmuramoyl-L-alanine amidase [Streptomyces corallincola]MBV2353727.1 N-acetylmuramoyl-L-alanine amidase [Streptomyces corallincola]